MSGPLLVADRIGMRYGNVVALDDVSLVIEAARVTCLLGDNGAGKTTLIRILSGVVRPTSGTLRLDGSAARFDSPREARSHGIATVHQDLALIPLMAVWRNFFLGAEPTRGRGPLRRIDIARCRSLAHARLAELGIDIRDVDQPVGTLSGGERQCIAIARAIHFGARIVILDEPTAALGVRQADIVLRFIAAARERGSAIVLVTHNPLHAHAAGDRFVILRHGRLDGVFERAEIDAAGLAKRMAGVSGPST